MTLHSDAKAQAMPIDTRDSIDVVPLVIEDILGMAPSIEKGIKIGEDIQARLNEGIKTYGKPLRIWNGRQALVDAYQEQLDATNYLKQLCLEAPNDHNNYLYMLSIQLVFAIAELL